MTDIIRLLPDVVANQIAAGEVVQRPASAVKELLENAIDSHASNIRLIIKDAGKSLIQVIDDGIGMSETDARLSFERHATSKIRETEDLFQIRTLGFRGEALASIAAVAQVEMKSKRREDELGTEILIEGSKIKSQSPCPCPNGTSIAVKNLFFNVPARRNFLKSDTAENNHILEEFFRIALVNQDTNLSFFNNGKQQYQLTAVNLKQRIAQLFGQVFAERLVNIGAETDLVTIKGFIGKPEFARKTRGEQYFFVNNRYFRHPFFHHAVDNAYRDLMPANHFPTYFIFFEIDPSHIDVNIHPTKTEIKLLNDKVIYSLLYSAVKQGLGRFSLTPSIDFDVEPSMDLRTRKDSDPVIPPQIKINPDYNPFNPQPPRPDPLKTSRDRSNRENWEILYQPTDDPQSAARSMMTPATQAGLTDNNMPVSEQDMQEGRKPFQLRGGYIVTTVKSGLLLIDPQRAHERILYEQFLSSMERQEPCTQHELFPHPVNLSPQDAKLLHDILPDLRMMGFEIEESRTHASGFIVSGVPNLYVNEEVQQVIEMLLENYKSSGAEVRTDQKTRIAHALARSVAMKPGKNLNPEEMNWLVDQLFSCLNPETSPSGKTVLSILSLDELERRFK
jgi:DNA mismatch repair protein MutL